MVVSEFTALGKHFTALVTVSKSRSNLEKFATPIIVCRTHVPILHYFGSYSRDPAIINENCCNHVKVM
jgi:hypothetical protein